MINNRELEDALEEYRRALIAQRIVHIRESLRYALDAVSREAADQRVWTARLKLEEKLLNKE